MKFFLIISLFSTLSFTNPYLLIRNSPSSYSNYLSAFTIIFKSAPKIISKEIYSKDDLLEVKLKIPQIENINLFEKINAELLNDAISFKNEVESIAKENSQEAKKYGLPNTPYAAFSDYKVNLNKNNILSLYIDYYQFTGGAHGSTVRKCYNYDLNTGERLRLNDLFKANTSYKEIINKEIENQINKNKGIYFPEYFKGISDNQCFSIDKDNLIIYFQQYDIAPYAAGIPEFKISLSKFNLDFTR
ncbi:peptidoglycan-N-acetylmuramic acid deacetylase PdaC [Clostridium homopropionicum DSM 5847]|uniref:Peptidoglycan-N-acetylmuramic acid deacetylase PdaC n=1 Tax=Clostridium homopropionicum DSM 5847 TaxID=1121318 RepID=A0A0L6Z7J7_9CLOT|nr:DUF3298 and DUF4163 domain-containing protein [Clostridium homopropionicum]KOA18941.1 peptidoglycan-N-acetylmuramic acid deacetylase PdaC [Clostridium homopropionicum DSM 5847]SFG43862.1 Protein of unknown function [Clostridium homopropionicum]